MFFSCKRSSGRGFLTGATVCSHNPVTPSGSLHVELVRGENRIVLQPGQPAPSFDLADADLNIVSLDSFRHQKNVVLYFYPRDDTPGCTMEAIDFSELEDDFSRLSTVVLGVSMDDCMSHGAFRDKHGLCVQ